LPQWANMAGMNTLSDLTPFIAADGKALVTDSRAVALAFGKRHKNVLQSIERMLANPRSLIAEHARLNFQPCSYAGRNGRLEPMYKVTAKGLSELAMGFSGDDAREIRIRFLNAFEAVSQRLAQAERSLSERLMQWEREAATSKAKGQIGSRLMHERKREKTNIDNQGDYLMTLAQPTLFH